MKRGERVLQENRTSSDYMVRFVHEVARYTKVHIRYNFLIYGKLQYLASL